MRTSKLTKQDPKASVVYPDDVKGPITITVTPNGGDSEPYTKKITFTGQDGSDGGQNSGGNNGSGDQGSGDDGGNSGDGGSGNQGDQGNQGSGGDSGGQKPSGQIEANVKQDGQNSRRVTVELTKTPSSGGPYTIDWGGKTNSDAPSEISKGQPVTATYEASVDRATITIDDEGNPNTEPFTKRVKFAKSQQQGDIVVEAKQNEENPREVTLTLKKAPGDSGSSGNGGGSGSGSQQGGQNPSGANSGSGSGGSSGQQNGGQGSKNNDGGQKQEQAA